MKKAIILALVLSMSCTGFVYAEESGEAVQTETAAVPTAMDIDKAVEYALENSNKIKSSKADTEIKRYQWSDAKRNYNNFQKNPYEASSFEVSLLRRGYYVDMTKLQYDSSLRTLEKDKVDLKNQVKTNIYTYYNNLKKQELAQKNLDNIKEKRSFAQARLANGTISQLDYTLFELSVTNAENALEKAERDTKLSVDEVKSVINYPADYELKILGAMPEIEISYAEPEEAIKASKTQNTYLLLADSFEAAKKRLTAAEGYYFPSEIAYQIEKYTYNKAEADFEINTAELENGIKKLYNQLLDLKNNIAYTEKYLDYLEKSTAAAYTKYEMGMTTANDYLEAEQEYYKAQNDYMDLLLTYRTTALQYKSIYTTEDDSDK